MISVTVEETKQDTQGCVWMQTCQQTILHNAKISLI